MSYYSYRSTTEYVARGIFFLVISLIAPVIFTVKSIQFQQNCSGYLKQAADANTVELALDRINLALNYIESHNLTTGYTSVVYRTEDENIGYWYQNIKACQKELENNLEASSLEKSNVLMKVRESLTDEGEKGTELTIPPGISRYPHNLAYGLLMWFSIFLFCLAMYYFHES